MQISKSILFICTGFLLSFTLKGIKVAESQLCTLHLLLHNKHSVLKIPALLAISTWCILDLLYMNALMCSISSMVEGSPSHTAHMWLMCTIMPSHVAFPQWWRGAPHVQLTYSRAPHMWLTCMVMHSRVAFPQWWREPLMYSSCVAHVHGNALMCSISSMVEGSPSHTAYILMCTSHVAYMHGNALTCSIPSLVEGSPSHIAHVWLMCMVMPSHVVFPQWWQGAPHVQLTCGSHAW